MPVVGEIARGLTIGYKSNREFMWVACPECGKERWVETRNRKAVTEGRCQRCAASFYGKLNKGRRMGPRASNWRGGRHVLSNGYVMITLAPDDPYAAMTIRHRHRSVYEHRIVMARHLGRCLEPWEEVHHKNHDKQDNRLENLEIRSKTDHAFGHVESRLYIQRIQELEAEIARLRARLAECERSHDAPKAS